MNENTTTYKKQNEEGRTIIEWTEFHYHLFSHLISDECPRDLAQDIELMIFPNHFIPNHDFLEMCVKACIESDDPEDLNKALTSIHAVGRKAFPNLMLKKKE